MWLQTIAISDSALKAQGKYEEALDYYQQALTMAEKSARRGASRYGYKL